VSTTKRSGVYGLKKAKLSGFAFFYARLFQTGLSPALSGVGVADGQGGSSGDDSSDADDGDSQT